LYNKLLQVNYSPIAALNRTYALAKVMGAAIAIKEAEKLKLEQTLQYHMLLGHLYAQVDLNTALSHLKTAENLTKREREKRLLADLQIKLQHLP
jgi:predicted RNA polymerase sigma factor